MLKSRAHDRCCGQGFRRLVDEAVTWPRLGSCQYLRRIAGKLQRARQPPPPAGGQEERTPAPPKRRGAEVVPATDAVMTPVVGG